MSEAQDVPVSNKGAFTSYLSFVLRAALTAPGFTVIAAVFGIAVLLTVLSEFGPSWLILAFGSLVAILVAIVYVCFSWILKFKKNQRFILSAILAYPLIVVVSASIVLVFWSAFFDRPLPLKTSIVMMLGTRQDAEILLKGKTEQAISRSDKVGRTIKTIILSETITSPDVKAMNIVDFVQEQNLGTGYHFIVDRSGFVYPMTDVAVVVGHTSGHNKDSIGIGLEHSEGEKYSEVQIAGLVKLLASLSHRLKLEPSQILSKEEVSPEYERDITKLMPNIREAVRQQISM